MWVLSIFDPGVEPVEPGRALDFTGGASLIRTGDLRIMIPSL